MSTREIALDRVRRTMNHFLHALDGVSEAQWRFKPTSDEWSLADTAEHVAKANQGIRTILAKQLSPLEADTTRVADDDIPKVFDREAPGPNLADPSGQWATRTELIQVLLETHESTLATVQRDARDLRGQGASHFVLGVLDGVQWLLFLAAHTERHSRQLAEIRATRTTRRAEWTTFSSREVSRRHTELREA